MASMKAAVSAASTSPAKGAAANDVLDRIGGALWGLYIGDALASPTHWYYGGAGQVARDYGKIKGYVKPKMELQGSIMNLSSTGGGGRGNDRGEIIGKVINHGKKEYWTARGSYHYHCTLAAGENTLEAQLVRQVCKSIVGTKGHFDAADLRKRYVDFMTTPGTHNDCYASTCHRMFFANMTAGKAPEKCPDNDNHNVDTIDGLIMAVPVCLSSFRQNPDVAAREAASCTAVTRNSTALPQYTANLSAMLTRLLGGEALETVLSSSGGANMDRVVKNAPHASDPVVA